jgi:hypothetical protein
MLIERPARASASRERREHDRRRLFNSRQRIEGQQQTHDHQRHDHTHERVEETVKDDTVGPRCNGCHEDTGRRRLANCHAATTKKRDREHRKDHQYGDLNWPTPSTATITSPMAIPSTTPATNSTARRQRRSAATLSTMTAATGAKKACAWRKTSAATSHEIPAATPAWTAKMAW